MVDTKGLKITDKHVFFWGGWPSNWYKAKIVLGNTHSNNIMFPEHIVFPTSEHLFMYYKAIQFNDKETAAKILESSNPREAKRLGRMVKGFNDLVWDKVKYNIMLVTNYHKYNQNKELAEELASPKYDGKVFVEASPYDKVWGIGMSMDDDGVDDEVNWKGQNLLGKIITEIRNNHIKAKDLVNGINWE